MEFKDFLLNENRAYLGQKIGDILNALQDLVQDGKSMGTRQLVKNSEGIVNQIRNILHSNWNKTEEKHLKDLQKVGVAIMKAIEEKDDLPSILDSSSQALNDVMTSLGVPINSLATPKDVQMPKDASKENKVGVAEPADKPQPKQQSQPQQPPQQQSQPPQQPPQQQGPIQQQGMQMPQGN